MNCQAVGPFSHVDAQLNLTKTFKQLTLQYSRVRQEKCAVNTFRGCRGEGFPWPLHGLRRRDVLPCCRDWLRVVWCRRAFDRCNDEAAELGVVSDVSVIGKKHGAPWSCMVVLNVWKRRSLWRARSSRVAKRASRERCGEGRGHERGKGTR